MSNNMINSTNLKNILSRFFDKEFDISERMLSMSEKYLFRQIESIDLSKYPEVQNTLIYLKNIMERNNLKTMDDLRMYYEKKRAKTKALFEKLEEIDPEECFALDFHDACTMYMKPIEKDHEFKNDLYHFQSSDSCCTIEIKVVEQTIFQTNVPSSLSYEEKENLKNILFLSQVKGNHLVRQEKKCCVSKKSKDAVVSN